MMSIHIAEIFEIQNYKFISNPSIFPMRTSLKRTSYIFFTHNRGCMNIFGIIVMARN